MTTTSYSLRRRMLRARRASYGPASGAAPVFGPAGTAPWSGPLIMVLAAWGGAVAYFGPVIGLGPAGAAPWHMTTAHTVLNLLPGAAGLAGGLAVTFGSRPPRPVLRRAGALLALAAAAWFVIGFAAYPVLFRGGPPAYGRTGGGPVADLGSIAAYGRGVGLLLCALAAVALARTAPAAAGIPAGGDLTGAPAEADEEDDDVVPVAIDLRDHVVAERAAREQLAGQRDTDGGGGWRPRLRPQVTRLVPGAAAGAEASGLTSAPTALVPRPHLVASAEPAESGWRPRFMSNPAPIGRAAGGGWLRSGEWVLANFGDLELRDGSAEDAGPVSAAVTNRRVVVASGGRARREWSLEALAPRVAGPPANPVPMPDEAALDFADPTAARDFAMAVRAAGQARTADGRR